MTPPQGRTHSALHPDGKGRYVSLGLIWKWDHLEVLSPGEFEGWSLNILPRGWSIVAEPEWEPEP